MATPSPDGEETVRVDSGRTLRQVRRAQFEPGAMVANRYRIAGILGSGGMGEVYRADDIKLGQSVALKFLPPARAADQSSLERLHDEVRLGRQIAHPNVCRIYDIGEWEGGHFVTMEYVDGEDLARLLHRIGRLAHDKAVDIARGITAGLAAAHSKGILHRDLKPANVMIDSHGDARITDFGLALAPDEGDQVDVAGTPAYMAPEQLDGGAATIQSDLYSLGLVLYEIFTGRRAHSGKTLPELRAEISSADVTTPSSVVKDIDPVVERVILRCLQTDPAERPRSARQVLESLPGGDPLAAAIAAGETPSPRLVAAAGTAGSLSPAQAWSWLAIVAALAVGMTYAVRPMSLLHHALSNKPPEVMREQARSTAAALGVPGQPFTAIGYEPNEAYVGWLSEQRRPAELKGRLAAGPALTFWLRQSPQPMTPSTLPLVAPDDPLLTLGGSSRVVLDSRGRLFALVAVPPAKVEGTPPAWNRFLAAAGIDPAKIAPAPATFVPPHFATHRAAWTGVHPDDARTPIRIEAASAGSAPVWFRITGPWEDEAGFAERQPFSGPGVALFVTVLFLAMFTFGVLLAWRNLRLRRGDRQGALRLALIVFAVGFTATMLMGDHYPEFRHELHLFLTALRNSVFDAILFWTLYIALEPYARRKWPERLISWTRLLGGRPRDPMVGRDVLIGLAAGLAQAAIAVSGDWVPPLFGVEANNPHVTPPGPLEGMRFAFAHMLGASAGGMSFGLVTVMLLVALTMLLRRRSLAVAAFFAIHLAVYLTAWSDPVAVPFFIALAALMTVVVTRLGVLAVVLTYAVFYATFLYPLVTDWSSWSAPVGVLPLVLIVALAVWAFRVALAGQNPFPARLLED